MTLAAGVRLGPYEIRELLGVGVKLLDDAGLAAFHLGQLLLLIIGQIDGVFAGRFVALDRFLQLGDSGLRALFNLLAMTVPYTMMEWGRDSVRKKYVKPLVSGEKLGCTCFSEPNAGSDIAAIETKVVDKGDHFLINGSKTWISNGTVADYAVVYCTHDRSLKHNGLLSHRRGNETARLAAP